MSERVLGLSSVTEAKSADDRSMHDVIGMVTDVLPLIQSAKGDREWTTEFSLIDQSTLDSGSTDRGTRCRFFRRNEADVPRVEIGDIVSIKHIKKASYRGPMLLSTRITDTIVFAKNGIPSKSYSVTYEGGRTIMPYATYPASDAKPTIAEQLHAIELAAALKGSSASLFTAGAMPTPAPKPRPETDNAVGQGMSAAVNKDAHGTKTIAGKAFTRTNQKFRLLRDVSNFDFADIVVEVIKIFPSPYGEFVELYVTDYTDNSGFFDYANASQHARGEGSRDGDQYGYITSNRVGGRDWPGPWGKMTLKVEVYPPHTGYVGRHVVEGSQILMSNVRIKMSRDNNLEGNLWPDARFQDKICITNLSAHNSELQSLRARKEDYWRTRAGDTEHSAEPGKGKPKTRVTGKERRRQRRMAERNAAAEKSEAESLANQNGIGGSPPLFDGKDSDGVAVQCRIDDVALSTIRDMLAFRGETKEHRELPFVNQKRRVKVQAVDFFPPELKDFSRLDGPAANDEDSDVETGDVVGKVWRWDFFLLLQDTGPGSGATCWVHVADEAAQKLLGLRATDLHSDDMGLRKLREQLFKLWGNLEEIKEQIEAMAAGSQAIGDEAGRDRWGGQLSNRPFECCILEYGQRLDEDDQPEGGVGWIRLHSMTDTTIK